jgi:signal transduction histidine kinase
VEFVDPTPVAESSRTRVVRATRADDGTPVVLKMPRDAFPDADTLARYAREKELLDAVDGHGAVRALALTQEGHRPVLVLEECSGQTLAQWLRGEPALAERLEVGVALAGALEQVHSRGVIHRDLSPSNVLVDPATLEVHLIDFGSAAPTTSTDPPRHLTGTLSYVAPELSGRLAHAVDQRSDLYSLGAVLYEVLTGVPPFPEEDALALIHAHLARRPIPPAGRVPTLPRVLSDVVLRCLEKNPDDRYQSAPSVCQDLRRVRDEWRRHGDVAAFPLGQVDAWSTVRLSRKVYGQGPVLRAIQDAWEASRQGSPHLVLVTGTAGSGKTSVLAEAAGLWAEGPILVGRGRCTPESRAGGAALDAVNALLGELAALPEDLQERWRVRAEAAVGGDAEPLLGDMPNLAALLGQADAPVRRPQPPDEARRVLIRLMHALAAAGTGLVLELDDLERADASTAELLQQLLLDDPVDGVLLVATMDADAPQHTAVHEVLRRARAADVLDEVRIEALGQDDITALLADSLLAPANAVRPLAEVLAVKTLGHPLALRHALQEMIRAGHIAPNESRTAWTWDLDAARKLAVSTNVADVLAAEASALPPADRALLREAAVLGSRFEENLLAAMRSEDSAAVRRQLRHLEAAGLVELGDRGGSERGSCQFTHERVRKVVLDATDQKQLGRLHLRAARALADVLSPADRTARARELADHWNAATLFVGSRDLRTSAARDNLEAAEQCWEQSDPSSALSYAAAGIALLGEAGWADSYDLTRKLYIRRLYAERTLERVADCLRTCDEIIGRAIAPEDTLIGFMTQCSAHFFSGDAEAAFEAARAGLLRFGVELTKTVTPKQARTAYDEAKSIVWSWESSDLRSVLQDVDSQYDPCRLIVLATNTFADDPYRIALHGAEIVKMVQRFRSVQAIAGLDLLAALPLTEPWRPEAVEEVVRISRLGDRMAAVLTGEAGAVSDAVTAAVDNHRLQSVCAMSHWYRPLRSGLDVIAQYHALTNLDPRVVVANGAAWPFLAFVTGAPLDEVRDKAEAHIAAAEARDLTAYAHTTHDLLEAVNALRSAGDPLPNLRLEARPGYIGADLWLAPHYLGHLTSLLFDRPDLVPDAPWPGFDPTGKRTDLLGFLIPESAFLEALSIARALPASRGSAKRRAEQRFHFLREAVRTWAGFQPDNYEHRHLLLEAEAARLAGDAAHALDLYDQAIDGAGRASVLPNQAIACEWAARFHLERGRARIARTYLEEARYLYGRWGALGKVAQLEAAYGGLLGRADGGRLSTYAVGGSAWRGSRGTSGADTLDLAAVMATAAAISSEVDLSRLLATLLARVVEAAGAERGLVIMQQQGRLVVEAAVEAEGYSEVLQHRSLYEVDAVASVVRHVWRAKEAVLVADASADPRYGRDRDVRRRGVRSVLAAPVLKQGALVAVVYLENNLQPSAFTPDRVELLGLLSGQIAVSIENSLLYQDLDRKVRERTAELEDALATLQRAQEQMVQTEKMASLGQLTAGVAHELNNAVNFIAGSTEPLRRDLLDLLSLLSEYEAVFAAHAGDLSFQRAAEVREAIDIDTVRYEVGELLKGIDEGARRTADIVQDLRTFSRLDDDEMMLADIRIGIDATLTLLHKTYAGRIQVERHYGDIPQIECLPGRLNQVFMNLLANAVQAISAEGRITITVRQAGRDIEIQIADTGAGMTEAVRRRIFEPFYTTKPIGVGTGLGLSITYGIIERHHGTITVDSTPGEGTTFTVRLPIRQPAPDPAS